MGDYLMTYIPKQDIIQYKSDLTGVTLDKDRVVLCTDDDQTYLVMQDQCIVDSETHVLQGSEYIPYDSRVDVTGSWTTLVNDGNYGTVTINNDKFEINRRGHSITYGNTDVQSNNLFNPSHFSKIEIDWEFIADGGFGSGYDIHFRCDIQLRNSSGTTLQTLYNSEMGRDRATTVYDVSDISESFRFWIQNDQDSNVGTSDYGYIKIYSIRFIL